jgi:RNA methyltransferase, TrmH family
MISSAHNPKIQAVRKLQAQGKERRAEQAFVIEGVRLGEEALQAGWGVRLLLYTDELDVRGKALVNDFAARDVSIEQVTPAVMKTASDTETPQGILAVLALGTLPLPPSPNFVLVLDGVRDPGNLGTILRTAAAAGVQAVLLAPGCADAYAPKVVRSAMGAHFRLPVHSLSWEEIQHYLYQPSGAAQIYLAEAGSGVPYTQADFRSPLALIVGGEAAGAGAESFSLAHERVHIPMPGNTESLNAAIATAILLFEVVRQRGK